MTHKIERLTAERTAAFPAYVERWTGIGLSTEPADRPRAEAAIRTMYETAGLVQPRVVWCGSPLSMALVHAILKSEGGDSVRASVWDSVGDSVRDSVRASVWASVGASVRASVGASVWASVRDSVGDSVRDSVGDSVWASVWASVGDSVWDSVGDSVRDSVRASVGDSVWASVWDSVGASVWASVGDSVRASVGDSVWASVRDSIYGQHDASWLAFYRYFRDELGLTKQTRKLDGLWEFCQAAGWAIPCRNVCFIAERHNVVRRDERGRLHTLDGPAVQYPDGFSVHAVHGVRIPSWIIETPEKITSSTINTERNSEIQRVMIECYGWDRYVADSESTLVDHDERWGTLRQNQAGLFLQVVNRSPESDGSFRKYILPVAPACEPLPHPSDPRGQLGAPQKLTALNAVASTFGLTGKNYAAMLAAES